MWNLRRRTRTRTAQLYVWFVVVAALWFVVQSSMMHQISLVQENRPKAVGGKRNFYDDAKGSERTLFHAALSPRPVFDEAINEDEERARCKRYNLQYSGSRKERRRIFAGSLIADDSWHAISGVALETYGEVVFGVLVAVAEFFDRIIYTHANITIIKVYLHSWCLSKAIVHKQCTNESYDFIQHRKPRRY